MTLNVHDLRNDKKRNTLFRYIKENEISFAALQETYFYKNNGR